MVGNLPELVGEGAGGEGVEREVAGSLLEVVEEALGTGRGRPGLAPGRLSEPGRASRGVGRGDRHAE